MGIRGAVRCHLRIIRLFSLVAMALTCQAPAQSNPPATPSSPDQPVATGAPLTLTLQDALERAKVHNPEFRSAQTDAMLAHEDKVQGRAGILPNLNFNTSMIYTEGNNSRSNTPTYIANNGVHEYISQGSLHQEFSLSSYGEYRRTAAAEAVAKARAEVATRGLLVTVVKAYYGLVVAQRKYGTEQMAAEEAKRFLDISQKLEKGGEVAHSDVIKARIQYEQQQRDLQEARLEMEKSRLELAVLLFADFNENFNIVDDLQMPQPLPQFSEAQAMATRKNPDLRAAVASVQAANHEVTSAWGNLVPSATVDYFHGIDLGSSVVASLQVPLWHWGANISKVKQADLRRNQAKVELSFAQRQLLSNLHSFYGEAETARTQLESLQLSAELAAEGLRLTTLRYQAGESTVLEVVDAQNTLTQARNAYADGQARYRTALATLQTVTGSF